MTDTPVLSLADAFTIPKPKKTQQTLLNLPVYVRDTLGRPWTIPQDTVTHKILVAWLTIGEHNDAVLPVAICKHPNDPALWVQDDPYAGADSMAQSVLKTQHSNPLTRHMIYLPHWALLDDWVHGYYTERFNEYKRSLSPVERKRTRRSTRKSAPQPEQPEPARVNPWA